MPVFTRERSETHEKFQLKLDKNPYFPFTKSSDGKKFVYQVRYLSFWVFLLGAALSAVLFIIFLATSVHTEAWFIISIATFIFFVGMAWVYRHKREYILDNERQMYTFKLSGREMVSSGYYNVYIRLRKKRVRSHTVYYLIFNGYRLEKQILSGNSSHAENMRALGQTLAANLNINYFDEPNVSAFHVIRHEKQKLQAV